MKWTAIRRVVRSGSIFSALVGLSLFSGLPTGLGAGVEPAQVVRDARMFELSSMAVVAFATGLLAYVALVLATMRMPATIADHESQTTFLAIQKELRGDIDVAHEFWEARNRERPFSRFVALALIGAFLVFVSCAAVLSGAVAWQVISSRLGQLAT